MRLRYVAIAPLAIAALALFGLVVMELWNYALVPATGWHALSYWQAVGVLILSKILFGGFRGGRMGWGGRRHWRHRMREKWEGMTPEEREKFREGMRGWCGQ